MIFNRLFKRKKKQEGLQIPRSAFLKIKPVRNPILKWEKNRKTREIKIIVPLKPPQQTQEKKGKKDILRKIFVSEPRKRIINLDRIGSIVWELCDGERTIGDIANYFVEKYKLMPEEAEISLSAYFNLLSKKGLVGFILPEDVKEKIQKSK